MRAFHLLCGLNQANYLILLVYGQERLRRDCAYANIYHYIQIICSIHLVCGLNQAHSFIQFYMYAGRDDCDETAHMQIYTSTVKLTRSASRVWF